MPCCGRAAKNVVDTAKSPPIPINCQGCNAVLGVANGKYLYRYSIQGVWVYVGICRLCYRKDSISKAELSKIANELCAAWQEKKKDG